MDRRVDVAIALTVAILGVIVLVATQQIRQSPVPDPVGPRGIPTLLGSFLVVAGLALALRRLLGWNRDGTMVPPEGTEDDPGVPPGSAARALSIGFASLLYVVTLSSAGFLIGTPVYIGFVLWRLQFDRAPVLRIPSLVVYPVVFTVATYLFFASFLGVRIPLGVIREIAQRVAAN